MTTAIANHPLLASCRPATACCGEPLVGELVDLARTHDQLAIRSRTLFEQLRKMLGQDRLAHCLIGIQTLAAQGEAAGARLLAAFLDANTPGSQLLPRVRDFASTRRLLAQLAANPDRDSQMEGWRQQVADVGARCERLSGLAVVAAESRRGRPRDGGQSVWLGRALQALVPAPRAAAPLPAAHLRLLAELVKLETDAYQERVSRLAGEIDPFRVSVIMRALPLLSRADAEIRDLRRLVNWLDEGNEEAAFRRRVPRYHDVLDESERPRLIAALNGDPRLEPLARLHSALLRSPLAVRQLAGTMAGLLALGRQMRAAGLRRDDLDLLTVADIVLSACPGGNLRLSLGPELQAPVASILMAPAREDGWSALMLGGLALDRYDLVLRDDRQGLGERVWQHDLPTIREMEGLARPDAVNVEPSPEPAEASEARSTFAVKQLVMANLSSVAIMLGFLRNPKIIAIPGLVADVARRSRSTRVVETIAIDHALHTGFANREVPRALLESPVNVPVKTLRKFIHVKYVSKVDLRRLAVDKSRLRKEVIAEIQTYLDSLL